MYTRAAPGELYTKAGRSRRSAGAGGTATPLVLAVGEVQSLLSLAGRAELKLCSWMALAYFFMFTACKAHEPFFSSILE